MISIVIPTLNAETALPLCLSALVAGVVSGVVGEVIVVDGGSLDRTVEICDDAGVRVVASKPGRGVQLAAGAEAARFGWLLFLHADTILEAGWDAEVSGFIERIESGQRVPCAAAFQFALDDDGFAPRLLERAVGVRSNLLRAPYGDQGLLVSRVLFDEVGGYREMVLMEDVDIVARLGRARITMLRCRAVTGSKRYRKDGYLARTARNQVCLAMYFLGFPVEKIARVYYRKRSKP